MLPKFTHALALVLAAMAKKTLDIFIETSEIAPEALIYRNGKFIIGHTKHETEFQFEKEGSSYFIKYAGDKYLAIINDKLALTETKSPWILRRNQNTSRLTNISHIQMENDSKCLKKENIYITGTECKIEDEEQMFFFKLKERSKNSEEVISFFKGIQEVFIKVSGDAEEANPAAESNKKADVINIIVKQKTVTVTEHKSEKAISPSTLKKMAARSMKLPGMGKQGESDGESGDYDDAGITNSGKYGNSAYKNGISSESGSSSINNDKLNGKAAHVDEVITIHHKKDDLPEGALGKELNSSGSEYKENSLPKASQKLITKESSDRSPDQKYLMYGKTGVEDNSRDENELTLSKGERKRRYIDYSNADDSDYYDYDYDRYPRRRPRRYRKSRRYAKERDSSSEKGKLGLTEEIFPEMFSILNNKKETKGVDDFGKDENISSMVDSLKSDVRSHTNGNDKEKENIKPSGMEKPKSKDEPKVPVTHIQSTINNVPMREVLNLNAPNGPAENVESKLKKSYYSPEEAAEHLKNPLNNIQPNQFNQQPNNVPIVPTSRMPQGNRL